MDICLCQDKHKDHGIAKVNFVFSVPFTGIVILDRVVAQWDETYLAPVSITTTTTSTDPSIEGTTISTTTLLSTTTTESSNEQNVKDQESTTSSTGVTTATETVKMIEQTRKHTMRCTIVSIEMKPQPMSQKGLESAKTRLMQFELVDSNALKLAREKNK